MRSAVQAASASEDFEALVQENLALRQELRRRKRRVVLRRVRRGSAIVLPIVRAISRKHANRAGEEPPVRSKEPANHVGAAHAAVAALVVARIVADARSHPPAETSSPVGAP